MTKYTRSNTCQYHCALCDECFASLSAFDLHLRSGGRGHRKPWKVVRLRLRTEDGQCKNMSVYAQRRRNIWEDREQTDAARERFRELAREDIIKEAKRRRRR